MAFSQQYERNKRPGIGMGYTGGGRFPRYVPYVLSYTDGGTGTVHTPEGGDIRRDPAVLPENFPTTQQDYQDLQLAWDSYPDRGMAGGASAYASKTENSFPPIDFSMYASYPMGEYTLAENSGLVKRMADAQTMNELDRITPLGWQGGTADYYNYYQLNKDRLSKADTLQGSAQTGSGEEAPVFAASAKTKEGEPLIIVDVFRVGEDAAVLTSNGRAIPIGQVLFDDYGAQAVYETAAEFPDADNAKRFLQLYTLSGLPAADFLQMYLDIALDDMQNGAPAQSGIGSNQADMPFGTEDVLPIGALNLSDDTLASIGTLFEQEGVPLPDGMDALWQEDIVNADGNGIMVVTDAGAAAESDSQDENTVTPRDLLATVMTPEQLQSLWDVNNQFWGLLDADHKQRLNDGEDLYFIFSELDAEKQQQVVQWTQGVLASLTPQQNRDLMFLGSGMLYGIDLKTRLAILQHLEGNEGNITYEDLVDIGVYEPGTLSENGFIRWLQSLDYGGPAHLGNLLSKEYQLNGFGTSFLQMDQELRMQQAGQRLLLVAMAAAPWIESWTVGRSMQSLKGKNFENNAYDNLERFGTTQKFKGSQNTYSNPGNAYTSGGVTQRNAVDLLDGIDIKDGKVGGKIPVDEFKAIRLSSVKNPDAGSITLGKYENGGANSYIAKAGKTSTYFDMGSDWETTRQNFNLSGEEMFNYFNKPVLSDAISSGKSIRFSHDPRLYETGSIVDEWEYIKLTMKLTDENLVFSGGFWYVK